MKIEEKRQQVRNKLLDYGKHLSNEQLDQFIDLRKASADAINQLRKQMIGETK